MREIISIDVGTTNLKMVLFNSNYKVEREYLYRYKKTVISSERFELDIDEIWQGMIQGFQDFKLKEAVDVILTTAMHSFIVLDNDLQALTTVFAWNDSRGSDYVTSDYYIQTGTPPHSMNPLFKVKAYKEWNEKHRLGSLKDVLYWRLTGNWWIDVANASATGMYDLASSQWSRSILDELQFKPEQLPTIYPSNKYSISQINALPIGSRIYLGTSDGVASNYAFNSFSQAGVLSIGTSHAVRMISDTPLVDKKSYNFCYEIKPKEYLIGYPSNNGGNVFEWANQVYQSNFDELEKVASQKNLSVTSIFLPYLNGERAPIWDDFATAEWFKLNRSQTREDILFSLMCGVFFNIKYNVERLKKIKDFNCLAVVGGISQSNALMQLLADILDLNLMIADMRLVETLGSIALVKEFELTFPWHIIKPNPKRYQRLEEGYDLFKDILEKQFNL